MSVQRRAVHRLIAEAAGPGGVSAAVAEARDITDEDLVRAQDVTVWASVASTKVVYEPDLV